MVSIGLSLPLLAGEVTLSSETMQASSESSSIQDCLSQGGKCNDTELKSGSSFSIDDVVNLGIVKHDEVASTQESTTGNVEKVSTTAALPSIDMEILFDYNSANIRPDQASRLREVAQVLSDPKFHNSIFTFVGHTDGVGSADYNRNLSHQRASAVAQFVSISAGIPQHQTRATGVGFDYLKTPSDPAGAQNRRVQLVLIPGS